MINKRLPAWDNMPECFGLNWLSLLPIPSGTQKSRQVESLGLAPSPPNLSLGTSWLGVPRIWRGLNLTQGQELVKDSGEGMHIAADFHPLLCHHIQKLPGFSALLQTIPADSVHPLGLHHQILQLLFLLPTQLMFLHEEHYYYLLEHLCPTVQMFFMGSHPWKLPEHPVQYFQIGIALSHLHNAEKLLHLHAPRFSIKMGANMQANLKLFLEDELEGHVPLISSGDVKGS